MSEKKRIVTIWFSILMVLTLLLPGCKSTNSTGDTSPDIDIKFSFPNGAPPLNQEAEFSCTINSVHNVRDFKVWAELPEALQLVSGESSWTGNITKGKNLTMHTVVKSVKTGHWEIRVHAYAPPEELPTGFTIGAESYPIYVSISENKAEWGEYKPWDDILPSGPPSNYTPPPISVK